MRIIGKLGKGINASPKTYSDYAISLTVPETLCLKYICSVTWNGDYDYSTTRHSLCLRKTLQKKFYYVGSSSPQFAQFLKLAHQRWTLLSVEGTECYELEATHSLRLK